MRWLALLSVVVVAATSSSCVSATVENHPADGYLHSGYFWPKTVYWRGIRHPPGIYWFVYFFFLIATAFSISGSLSNWAIRSISAKVDEEDEYFFDISTGFLFALVTLLLGSGLLFVSVAAANLSDVVQAYMIGMCIIQLLVDTVRSTISCKFENFYAVYFTVLSFQVSSVFGIALLDSYRPLNQLNAAYTSTGGLVAILITVASVGRTKRYKVVGFVAGLLQMVFCVAAFFVANRVDDVNKTQTTTFLVTVLVNFLLVSLISLKT